MLLIFVFIVTTANGNATSSFRAKVVLLRILGPTAEVSRIEATCLARAAAEADYLLNWHPRLAQHFPHEFLTVLVSYNDND